MNQVIVSNKMTRQQDQLKKASNNTFLKTDKNTKACHKFTMSNSCTACIITVRFSKWPIFRLTVTAMELPTHALLVKQPWAALIVKGEKTWELRSTQCQPRRVAIAESGASSPRLLGEVTVTHCVRTAQRQNGHLVPWGNPDNFLGRNVAKHHVTNWTEITYDRVWAWSLCDAVEYAEPKSYDRKPGQQVCVKLSNADEPPQKRRRSQ